MDDAQIPGRVTREQVAALRAQGTPLRRDATLTVAALSLCAGLTTGDIVLVRGHDLQRSEDGTVIGTVRGTRPRTTVLTRRYEELAWGLAAQAGPGWVVNPNVEPAGRQADRALTKQLPGLGHLWTNGPRFQPPAPASPGHATTPATPSPSTSSRRQPASTRCRSTATPDTSLPSNGHARE